MNLYLKVLEAKEGNRGALEDIISTYKIFANIQMKKYDVEDIEGCYSEIVDKICQCVNNYKTIKSEKSRKVA